MKATAFWILFILCFPLILLGMAAFMIPVLLTRGKVSGTAYEPFGSRYFLELLRLRADPSARELARHLPATSLVARLCIFHLVSLLCRIVNFIPTSLMYPAKDPEDYKTLVAVRTEFIDSKLEGFLRDNHQLVILGAGWDTRAYNLPQASGVTVFEIDAPATQAVKRRGIERSKLNQAGTHFIACDFEQHDWLELLQAHPAFDAAVPTFVIWEGVSMYLSGQAISQTFERFRRLPRGSEIVFDMLPAGWWQESRVGRAAARSIEVAYGERFVYFLPMGQDAGESLQQFLTGHGLDAVDSIIQSTGEDKLPFYCVVQASRSTEPESAACQ